jgi:pimeloyl-ACP methyl ester carboxylesterase
MSSDAHVYATTSDGLRLSIRRFAPRDGRARAAVVLQHGLGSTNLGFMVPGVSLAEHLAELGFDCYVPELRGSGLSERPRGGWSISDYLERDIPAIVACVLAHSGQSALSWIGHSLGGVLMFMYGIEHPSAPIERLITVGSTLDYRPGRNVYRALMKLRPLGSVVDPVPFGFFARANALVAGSGPRFLPESMNFVRGNVAVDVCKLLLTSGFATIPMALLDDLATTFSEDGFFRESATDGRIVYLTRASAFRIPTLLLGGNRDPQCPPIAVQTTFDALSGLDLADKHMRVFGRAHGHGADYGHFDLIVGRNARDEVWPHICDFLCGQAPPAVNEPARWTG